MTTSTASKMSLTQPSKPALTGDESQIIPPVLAAAEPL